MRRALVPIALFLTTAGARTAAAQPAGEFLTLDRADHESRAGLFVGLLHIEDTDFDEGGLRMEMFGQVVGESGLGGYISVPIHRIMVNDEDDEGALGGVEVGALMARSLVLGQELALRGGLVLPTAQGESFEDFIANIAGVQTRLTDLVQAVPKTSTLRLSGSWLGSLPGLVYRIDGGFDVPLFTTEEEAEVDHNPIIRLNGAIGLGLGPGTLAFELVNLISTESEGDISLSDRSLTNAGVSLGVSLAGVRVQGGLFLSVDSVLEDDADEGLVTIAASASRSW